MGNANCKVHNDTNQTQHIYVFNYADGLRISAGDEHYIEPGQTVKCEAAPHGSGLIIATAKGSGGHHKAVSNGATLNVSELLKAGGNSWHGACKGMAMAGMIVGVAAAGAATGGAAAGPLGACMVAGEAATTGVVTAAAASGGVAGAAAGGLIGVQTLNP